MFFARRLKGELRGLQADVHRLRLELAKVRADISSSSGPVLMVRVNELETALEQLQRSNRRELGRLWKLVSLAETAAAEPTNETPDQTRARLREQHGLPRIGKPQAAE